ncbi:MAG TPA: DUF6090 family protein [Saprospiraceae bacterium]|nr:DUF6090 family protein [Saprospiraceae bacterium]
MMGVQSRFKSLFSIKSKRNISYVLTEIFIISLGVLIAIALNNWNEERKDGQEELKFLKTFRDAMKSDSIDYASNIAGAEQWIGDISDILKFFKYGNTDVETLDFQSAGFSYIYAIPTSLGIYEELKGKGISFLKDDTLRSLITMYFENELANCRVTEQQFSFIREDLRAYYTKYFTGWSDNDAKPLDLNYVRSDPYFTNLIEQKQERLNYLSYINSSLIKNVSDIRNRICYKYGICD